MREKNRLEIRFGELTAAAYGWFAVTCVVLALLVAFWLLLQTQESPPSALSGPPAGFVSAVDPAA